MSDDLQTYLEYKDSGVDWLCDVPAHWDVVPLYGEYEEKQVKNRGMIENTVLSLSYGRIIIKPAEKLHGLVPESFETYQIVDPGNIIIRPTDLQNDHTSLRIGFSQHRGIITSAYICLRTWNDLSSEYGYHVLNVFDLTKAIYGYGSGLRQNLSFAHIKRVGVPVPPPDEQDAIVRFLNVAENRIGRYIRAKQRLIKLLNEQKQGIIQQVVTRGLNPDVPMKDSGVEWLGEIPEHWEMRRVRTLVKKIEQGVSPDSSSYLSDENSWGVLKSGCANRGVFRETEHKRLPDGFLIDPNIVVHLGDVIISRASGSPALVGSTARVRDLTYNLILSDKTFRPIFHEPLLADFIVYSMNTRYYRIQVEQGISGAEGLANNLPVSELKDFRLAIPPLVESKEIVTYLDREIPTIDGSVARN